MEYVGAFPCSELDSFTVPDFLDHSPFHGGQVVGFSPSLEAENGVATMLNEGPETALRPVSQQCSYYSRDLADHMTYSRDESPGFNLGFDQIQCHSNVFLPADMFMGTGNPHVAAICSDVGVEETEGRAASFIATNDLALAKETPKKRKLDVLEKNIVEQSENVANKRIRIQRDGGSEGQSSCSYSSEEENVGKESKQCLVLNSNGKARAARGGATDPQSLYARKRRERINERLKILQNLVPNGTKVDISTMLEEAVHYVKFLQLQIKLLSSDDLWMYAPLAYNGFDMGLHMKIFSQFTRQ